MAKGKNATALFEVMSKARLAGLKTGATAPNGGIPTPKWWFKSKNKADARVLPPEESLDSHDEIPEVPQRPPQRSTRIMPPLASSIDVPNVSAASTAQHVKPLSMSVDSDRQQINLRLSYMSALIGGFGLLIAIGVAILIGKSMSRGPSTAIANTNTQTLRSNPPTPGVMDVPRRGDTGGNNDVVEGAGGKNAGPSTGSRNPQNPNGFNDPRPPSTFFTDDAHRQNGLNYAIIQSYPDEDTANKASEFLTKHGIACTVEKDLPGWKLPSKDWRAVVGIRGFAKVINNPVLDSYKKLIMEISVKFSTGKSRFAGFAPSMYLWKKAN